MSFELGCPQCVCVSRQLGQPTPCLLHVSIAPDNYDEPFEFGHLRPTVDRPDPFSLREYVRLQLVRTRLQAHPSALDSPPAPGSQSHPPIDLAYCPR